MVKMKVDPMEHLKVDLMASMTEVNLVQSMEVAKVPKTEDCLDEQMVLPKVE